MPSQGTEFLEQTRFLCFSKGDAVFVKTEDPDRIHVSGSPFDIWRQLSHLSFSSFLFGEVTPSSLAVLFTSFLYWTKPFPHSLRIFINSHHEPKLQMADELHTLQAGLTSVVIGNTGTWFYPSLSCSPPFPPSSPGKALRGFMLSAWQWRPSSHQLN